MKGFYCARCNESVLEPLIGPFCEQCPTCLAFVEPTAPDLWSLLFDCGVVIGATLAVVIACLLLSGCAGAPFTAGEALELEPGGGAGGAMTSTNQGGAAIASAGGGQTVLSNSGSSAMGDAGAGGVATCTLEGGTAAAFAAWTSGDGGPPSSAVDGSSATRWASGVPQAAGQWFEVTLPAPLELERLVLSSRASDVPAGPVVLELDGAPIAVTLSSSTGSLELEFAPRRASVIRLELEQPASNWWSIDELTPGCP